MKKLDLSGGSDDETLLHADADYGLTTIAEGALAYIGTEFRRKNPDKPEEWRMMCGGCLTAILRNMMLQACDMAEATPRERKGFYRAVGNDPMDDPNRILYHLLRRHLSGSDAMMDDVLR